MKSWRFFAVLCFAVLCGCASNCLAESGTGTNRNTPERPESRSAAGVPEWEIGDGKRSDSAGERKWAETGEEMNLFMYEALGKHRSRPTRSAGVFRVSEFESLSLHFRRWTVRS